MSGTLTLKDARFIVDAAVIAAVAQGLSISAVVLDAHGHDMAALRMDESMWAGSRSRLTDRSSEDSA